MLLVFSQWLQIVARRPKTTSQLPRVEIGSDLVPSLETRLLLGVGRYAGLSSAELLVASSANIGGPATARRLT